MSSQLNQNSEKFESDAVTLFDRIFRDKEGKIVIIQPPNLPIILGTASTVLHFLLPSGRLQSAMGLIAYGVLFTWAWMELFEGVNYFRRGLGLVVLAGLVALSF